MSISFLSGRRAAVAALVPMLVLTGCGSGAEEKPKKPEAEHTGNVKVPKGVKITEPGTELDFGEKAVVAHEPNSKANTVLELTVEKVVRGSIDDLSMYTLDAATRKSVPYYVDVTVKNAGDGDVGRTPVPLYGLDDTDRLLMASGFTNTFEKCPSKPLPRSFAPNDSTTACLVYLVPAGAELTGVSFRPLEKFAPIEWTGEIATGKAKPEKKKPEKKG